MASHAQAERAVQAHDTAYVMERNGRSRSLISQITTVLLQPVYFFRTFPATSQWVWVALIILALVGFSAVRQPTGGDTSTTEPGIGTEMPPISGPGGVISGPGMMDPGAIPLPTGNGGGSADTSDVSQTTMTALLAAGAVVLVWLGQAVVLSEVSLLNGSAPKLGRNLQIAVYASVPIGLMAALQLLYYASGGKGGLMGLSLLLEDWTWYQAQPEFLKMVIYSLASRTTLFWLWSLVLLYLGARHALRGHRIAAFIAITAWLIVITLVPVVTNSVTLPVPEAEQQVTNEIMGPEGMSEGMMNGVPNGLSPEGLSEGEPNGEPNGETNGETEGQSEGEAVAPIISGRGG